MRNRSICIVLLSSALAGCAAAPESLEHASVPDAIPTPNSRYHFSVTQVRRTELSADAAKRPPQEVLRSMNFALKGEVDVTVTALTASGYDLHWQAAFTEPEPGTKPGAPDDIARQMHLFRLNQPVDLSIDLRHARPEATILNATTLRQQSFVKARELFGARAAELGCNDESEQTRCPLIHGSETRVASTIASQVAPLFACSGRRLTDPSLTEWREVRRAEDVNIELAVRLAVHHREIDAQAKTMQLQLETIPDAESYKGTDEAAEIVRKVLQGTRMDVDCTISTVSAIPLALEYIQRSTTSKPEATITETVKFERRAPTVAN
jgi:hypothetical protein